MLTKKAASRKHAKRRAYERFGIELKTQDIRQFVDDIQKQKENVSFVKALSNRVSCWKVSFNVDKQAYALYDKSRKVIVTFLPTTFEV